MNILALNRHQLRLSLQTRVHGGTTAQHQSRYSGNNGFQKSRRINVDARNNRTSLVHNVRIEFQGSKVVNDRIDLLPTYFCGLKIRALRRLRKGFA